MPRFRSSRRREARTTDPSAVRVPDNLSAAGALIPLDPAVAAGIFREVQSDAPPPDAPVSQSASGIAWVSLWSVLAVLHVTQGIWLSRGAAYPGDLGDGRFNQLVLEHGYQSLLGVYTWSSPSLFYPTAHMLGVSDTHAGTLPIYVVLRSVGFSIERAWQAWFVVVAALNTFAAFRLFAALGIIRGLRAPLVFAAVASTTTVWLAGTHMQMLPFFPALFAWTALVRWTHDRTANLLLLAGGWLAWQFAAGPYLAFFAVMLMLAIGGLRWLAGFALPEAGSPPPPLNLRDWLGASVIAIVGGTLAVMAATVYIQAVKAGAARSMEEIRDLAPHFQSWFTASPAHVLYPEGWPGQMPNHVEHAWLAGFLPWLLLLPALIVGWRSRRTGRGAWLLAAAGGALITALFLTQWGKPGMGAWILAAQKIEALRAFRAAGRVAVLLQVVEIAAAGLLLSHWLAASSRRRRTAVGVLTGVMVAEGLGWHQPATQVSVAAQRAESLMTAWHEAGDRPVLAYAFGYTNQPDAWLHLDAWSAALRLKRATFNGYSGGLPGDHQAYIWNSTVANARALASGAGIPLERVSIVEHLAPAEEAALGIERNAQRGVEALVDFDLQPQSWVLFSPLERWPIDGVTMYQFTPDAEVRFRVPDGVSRIEHLVGFRPDAYTFGGKSDGAGVSWFVQSADQPEKLLSYELLTPLTNPAHRGLLPRTVELPSGRERVLILRTDTGPAHFLPWDFLLVGRLRVK